MSNTTYSKKGRPCHILIVDDHEDTAESFARLLGLYGHQVSFAVSGPKALAAIQQQEPDIVLLDLHMPGMDGYALARQIRRLPLCEQPLIVALSGMQKPEIGPEAQEVGIHIYLRKPAEPQFLLDLVQKLEEAKGCSRAHAQP
jgi:CheY-like chemotaxis protein